LQKKHSQGSQLTNPSTHGGSGYVAKFLAHQKVSQIELVLL